MATTKQKPKPLPRNQAEQLVAGDLTQLPDKYLNCRDLRHDWKIESNFHDAGFEVEGDGVTQAVERIILCKTCGTRRTDVSVVVERANSVPRMEKLSSQYRYPKGYLMKRGQIPRDIGVSQLVRYETLRRVLAETAQ